MSQSTAVSASSTWAAAIETCSVAANAEQREPRDALERRAGRSLRGRGAVMLLHLQRPLGGGEHVLRLQGRQAAKVARLADALIARTAGKALDFDRLP